MNRLFLNTYFRNLHKIIVSRKIVIAIVLFFCFSNVRAQSIDSSSSDVFGTLSGNLFNGQETTSDSTALFKLSDSNGQSDEVRLVLRIDASSGLDSYDAYHLSSLTSSYVSLSSIVDSTKLSIDSRPVPDYGPVEMDLLAENINPPDGTTDTLSLADNGLPSGWQVTLSNVSTGEQYNLSDGAVGISVKIDSSGTEAANENPVANWQVIITPPDMYNLKITGSAGWHMYGSPFVSSDFGTLLDSLWTQGFPGADATNGSPNVYTWDEATQSWTVPSSQTTDLTAGEGFAVFVYSDNNAIEAGTQGGFPKSLYYTGNTDTLPQKISLRYTKGGTTSLDGFNLVSNPSASSINWEQFARTNVSATYYIWDPSTGQYAAYQSGGTGTNGGTKIIAPFQGFWVQATGASASLNIDSTATDTGGTLFKKNPVPSVTLRLQSSTGQSDEVSLVFRNDSQAGLGPWDAIHMTPLTSSYLCLSSVVDSAGLAIDSRPMPQMRPVSFNLSMRDVNIPLAATNTLDMVRDNLPAHWTVTLVNKTDGTRYNLSQGKIPVKVKHLSLKTAGNIMGPIALASAKANWQVVVNPSTTTGLEITNLLKPKKLALDQNYPNPFNPTTTIHYTLPKAGEVRLRVYNILGQRVATLVDKKQLAGYYDIRFDASKLASGMYLYRLVTPSRAITKHMLLIK